MSPLRVALLGLATVFGIAAACNEYRSSGPSSVAGDGGSAEAAAAAADAGARGAGVRVVVSRLGAPLSGVRVVAHDAEGAPASDAKTDAAGVVTFATAPSIVTVLSRMSELPAAVTYFGVEDGDVFAVDEPAARNDAAPWATFSTTVGPFAGADVYATSVGYACRGQTGAPPTAMVVELQPRCLEEQNAVLVQAIDGTTPVAFGFLKNVSRPNQGSTVTLAPIALSAAGHVTVTATNVPEGANIEARLGSIANGTSHETGLASGDLATGGLRFPIAVGFAEAYQTLLNAISSDDDGNYHLVGFLRRAAASATLAHDFAAALPRVEKMDLVGLAPRPELAITTATSIAAADGGFATLLWSTSSEPGDRPRWSFVFPAGTTLTKFRVPQLPRDPEAALFVPRGLLFPQGAVFVESSLVSGYRALKSVPVRTDGNLPAGASFAAPLPAVGTVRATAFGFGTFATSGLF